MGAGLGAGLAVGQQMGGAFASAAAASGVVVPGHTSSPGSTAPAAGGTPPPLPSAVAFHAAIDGAASGPFDMATLAGHAKAGKLTRKTLVWKPGMASWASADTIPE